MEREENEYRINYENWCMRFGLERKSWKTKWNRSPCVRERGEEKEERERGIGHTWERERERVRWSEGRDRERGIRTMREREGLELEFVWKNLEGPVFLSAKKSIPPFFLLFTYVYCKTFSDMLQTSLTVMPVWCSDTRLLKLVLLLKS